MGSPKMYRGTPKTPHTNGPQNHTGGRTLRTAVVCSSKAKKPTGCKDAGLYVQKSAFCRLNKDGVVGKKEGNTKLWHRYISAKRNSSTYKQVVRVCCCKDLSTCLRFLCFFFLFRRGHGGGGGGGGVLKYRPLPPLPLCLRFTVLSIIMPILPIISLHCSFLIGFLHTLDSHLI